MNWHTIVPSTVSQAVGGCGLTRAGVVHVLACLHNELPARVSSLRRRRDPADPDLFIYRVTLVDGGVQHRCDFRVNDTSAPGFLLVVDLTHHRKNSP